jgi:hypothetical protein
MAAFADGDVRRQEDQVHMMPVKRRGQLPWENAIILGELWPYGLSQAGSSAVEHLSELSRLGFVAEILSKDNSRNWSSYATDR